MANRVTSADHKRLVLLSIFLVFLYGLLLFQYYRVQIIDGEKWKQRGVAQHHHTIIEPFMRGRFFSNTEVLPSHAGNPQPFVIDVTKYHLFIDPDSIGPEHKNFVAGKLIASLSADIETREKVIKDLHRKSRSRKIATWIDRDKKEEITRWWLPYAKEHKIARNAIFFLQDYQRSYPFGSLMGTLLHTVQDERDPSTLQSIPTGGLEQYFHPYLQGKKGIKKILSSPRHRLDGGKTLQVAENGADIYLTINHHLQAIAEQELEKGVKNVNAKGGWALMMDPNTGEILALAQYPFFDPRRFKEFFNRKEMVEHTRVKAVMDAHEPGSIFKPIVLAICMQANEELIDAGKRPIFHPSEKIPTLDGKLPGRKSNPIKDGRAHRYLNMCLAIQKSSNIYMARVVQKTIEAMGEEWFKNALGDLMGFGSLTGVEVPAEVSGLVPTPGKINPNGTLEWSLSTPYTISMGHNILVNSVQMARAFSMIVNGGWDVKPTLVRKIIKTNAQGESEVLLDQTKFRTKFGRKRILAQNTADELKRAMKFTTKLGGTAWTGDIAGYTEGGKSGTSEKIIHGRYSHERYVSSYVGFAPANNPRFVLLISIDEPEKKFVPGKGKLYHGGVCAAPIFKEIGQKALKYLGVAPDDPFGYPYGDPRRNVSKADWTYEVKELKEVYERWNTKK